MYQVRTTCPACDVVTVSADAVTVRMCSASAEGSYTFRCPSCGLAIAHQADKGVANLLLSAGVTLVVWHPPAELDEHREGPPICHDDLLTLHDLLDQPDWFDALAAPPH